jgi:hypothetical protein
MRKIFILTLIMGLLLIAGIRFATPTSQPEPAGEVVAEGWTVMDSKAYAQDKLYEWQYKQWECLNKLWIKESNWRPNAYNKVKVMGKNAGGIPQLLGLDPKTPAPKQIDRGLSYIYNRYHTPCEAWKFFNKKGYY